MPASLSHQKTAYIVAAASATIETLAQQHFDLSREIEGAADNDDCRQDRLRSLQSVVNAIGNCRFPFDEWKRARDAAGFNQNEAA